MCLTTSLTTFFYERGHTQANSDIQNLHFYWIFLGFSPYLPSWTTNQDGEGGIQSEPKWKHMKLNGSIKNKMRGFPTLNPTPYVFTEILPPIFNNLEPSNSPKMVYTTEVQCYNKSKKEREKFFSRSVDHSIIFKKFTLY